VPAQPGWIGVLTRAQLRITDVDGHRIGGLERVVSQIRDVATSFEQTKIMERWGVPQ
jgi:hypothetical protein